MKKVSLILLVCSLAAFPGTLIAGNWGVFGGGALPQGEYADDDATEDESGFTKTGFGIGVEYEKPLATPGLSWYTSALVILNSFDTDALEDVRMDDLTGSGYDVNRNSISAAGYKTNIPLVTGVKYQQNMSPTLDWFGFGQIGFNFISFPDLEKHLDIGEYYLGDYLEVRSEEEWKFDSARELCFIFGGGVVLYNKYQATFRYCQLGTPEMEGDYEAVYRSYINNTLVDTDSSSGDIEIDQPIKVILFTLGIIL